MGTLLLHISRDVGDGLKIRPSPGRWGGLSRFGIWTSDAIAAIREPTPYADALHIKRRVWRAYALRRRKVPAQEALALWCLLSAYYEFDPTVRRAVTLRAAELSLPPWLAVVIAHREAKLLDPMLWEDEDDDLS